MQTPTSNTRSYAALPTLSRMYTTPAQRPSTSAGEAIEPTSTLLRKALFDKRQSPMRPQSTTPRKNKPALRSTSYMDPWMPSDEEEVRPRITRSQTSRPARRRRATDLGNTRPAMTPSPPPSPSPGVGNKVAQHGIDKLKKENWDLKHRIALQQQHATRLQTDLEQALSELARSRDLRERNTALEKERDRLRQKLSHSEDQNKLLEQELKSLDEEVSIEMDHKDGEIRDRQLAIEEAAGIIQKLELENHNLQEAMQRSVTQQNSPQADSDYFSGDHDGEDTRPAAITPVPIPMTPMHDSDYFSADTSPNLPPRAMRRTLIRTGTERSLEEEARRANTRRSAAVFNREVGLKCIASRDSLLFNYLESGTPRKNSAKTLRHRISRLSGSAARVPSPARAEQSPSWGNVNRPLRELYRVGELGRQVHSDSPIKPRSLSPSTQASVSEMSRSTTSDDRSEIFSQVDSNTTRASSPATVASMDTITGVTLKGSSSSLPLELKYRNDTPNPAHIALPESSPAPASRTPVNYDMWPRKYPEWPPSASLHNRDVLFHDNDDAASINTEKSTSPSRYSEDDSAIGLGSRTNIHWKSTLPRRSDTSLVTLPQRMDLGSAQDLPQRNLDQQIVMAKSQQQGGATAKGVAAASLAGVGKLSRSLQGSLHGVGRPWGSVKASSGNEVTR